MREKVSQTSNTLVNQNQIKRLYTFAMKRDWTREGVHDLIWYNYRVQTTKDLTQTQYDEIIKFIETSIVPNIVTMRRDENTEDVFNKNGK